MWVICLVLSFLGASFGLDWHARCIFLSTGYRRRYGHGKSGNRAEKHYKTHWTFWQRMFWVPVFKESYESDFRFLAYFSYIHFVWTIITIIWTIVYVYCFPESKIGKYQIVVYCVFSLLRYIHTVAVLNNNYKKRSRFSEKRD